MKKIIFFFLLLNVVKVKAQIIIVDNNFVINDKKFDISNLVLFNDTDEIKIESNINLNTNGEYIVKFIIDDQNVIERRVIVDILENSYEELKKEYKNLVKEKNKLEKKLEDISALKKEIKNNEKIISKLENDIKEKEQLILKQNNFNKELIKQNNQNFDNLKLSYENALKENNIEFERIIFDKEEYINSLVNMIEVLNKKIVNQNTNINYLEQINNDNNTKYLNELSKLNIIIDNLTNQKNVLMEDKNKCFDEKTKILKKESQNNQLNFYQNIIVLIITFLSFIFCILKIKKM